MSNVDNMGQRITGEPLHGLLSHHIGHHRRALATALAPLDPASAIDAWFETLRAIEEFINLPLFGIDNIALKRGLLALPLDAAISRSRHLRAIRHGLAYRYDTAFIRRLMTLMMQGSALGNSFAQHGMQKAARGLATVADAVGYFQSRRRHLVALLYTLPTACRGQELVGPLDALSILLPLVELNGTVLTGLYQHLMLAHALDQYAIVLGPGRFEGTHVYPALDQAFLEPERTSIIDMYAQDYATGISATLEPVALNRLFSAAELRNDIRILTAAYEEFDLAESLFGPAALLVERLSRLARDDYWINISISDLNALIDQAAVPVPLQRALVNSDANYVSNTNSYTPFVQLGDRLRTTVTLLSRFLYHWKNVCLQRDRRYQIRSGFIFEATVREKLIALGFSETGIKRVNRREFDVVTRRDGVIFNVQCKNNFIDPASLESDVRRFARYHRRLISYYERALVKETGRETLLLQELRGDRIEHVVISRFPVATDNPRIISFSRIGELDDVARTLTAERT